MLAISGGNSIGPLICGFVVQSLGWRWHKWMAAIFTGVNFLAVVFFVPETRYERDYSSSLESTHGQSLVGGDIESPDFLHDDKKVGDVASGISTPTSSSSRPSGMAQIPKKTYAQQLSLWSGTPTNTNLLQLFIRPFPLIIYPAVFFAFLAYAVSLAWVVAVNILNSFILEAPPYNWGTAIDGLINIPGFIGNLVGAFAGGWCVDRYCDWRARKNAGVFQPESRLTLLVIPILIVPAGCLLFGYGVQNVMSWTTLFFGYGMLSLGLTSVYVLSPFHQHSD